MPTGTLCGNGTSKNDNKDQIWQLLATDSDKSQHFIKSNWLHLSVSDNAMSAQEPDMDLVGAGAATPRSRTPTRLGGFSPKACPIGGRGEPAGGPVAEIPDNGRHNLDNRTLIYGQIGPILWCPRILLK